MASKPARRTRPFSGRAFREHRTSVGVLPVLYRGGFREHQRPTRHPSPLTGWNIDDIRRTMNIETASGPDREAVASTVVGELIARCR